MFKKRAIKSTVFIPYYIVVYIFTTLWLVTRIIHRSVHLLHDYNAILSMIKP